jgi:uncharacterized protein YidB (DUF937 family)
MSGKSSAGGLEALLGALAGGQSGLQELGALVGRLRQAGLGDEVDSWVGNGPNRDLAPQQLDGVFGQDELAGLAERFGGGGSIMAVLARLLPHLINGLTPQGRVPQSDAEYGGGGIAGVLAQMIGMSGGHSAAPPPAGGYGLDALLRGLAGMREAGGAPTGKPGF